MADQVSILRCSGNRIVDAKGEEKILRGACLGGYLLQENFTNGFPGHEKAYRKAMLKVLGQERYDHFWNKFYEYFYAEADAKYFASLGLNLIRVAINYRHLNDDLEPDVIKQEGFKWIDRVIELNAAQGIYTIVDLHAAPGGQNFDWHSDNSLPEALLWEHKDFQDRTVRIWEAIAARYRGNPWVAGYNLLNEPTDESPGATRLLNFYTRLAKAVRAVDPDHILCFDGNTFGADFSGFEAAGFTCENSIFSCHDYATYGFPGGPIYNGTSEDRAKLRKGYERKAKYSKITNTPVWNGEFGIVYATPDSDGADWERVNDERYACLRDQLRLYADDRISWTIWLYKDIGVQGMVHTPEDSLWNKTFADSLAKKRKHALDFWGTDSTATERRFQSALDFIKEEFPNALPSYPPWWSLRQHFFRRTLYSWISDNLCEEFVQPMAGMSFEQLDELAGSFKLENCVSRSKLIDLLKE